MELKDKLVSLEDLKFAYDKLNENFISGSGSVDSGALENWELLSDVTLDETSIPVAELGDSCKKWKKFRVRLDTVPMTPITGKTIGFCNSKSPGVIFQVFLCGTTATFGNSTQNTIFFSEIEEVFENYFKGYSTVYPVTGINVSVTHVSYHNSYDYESRYANGNAISINAEMPSGTRLRVWGVK